MKKGKILVTGGCGYIGAHTIVDLVENGFDVVSIDNLSRGKIEMLYGVNELLNKEIRNYPIDICDQAALESVFEKEKDIAGIIHFAAYKSVPESVTAPLLYYNNNLTSLLNILRCCIQFQIRHFVFSSSCSVYGNAEELPVTESTPLQEPESPYAATKVMGERICADFAKAHPGYQCTLLRYFNPVGAHPSAKIGEMNEQPENLVPVITQTAIGKREKMGVFGTDYDTRDGSCIRDYIHVSDIAHAHTLALQKSISRNHTEPEVHLYNLGTGQGVTVLELIHSFEKVSGVKLNYELMDRRPGDVVQVYADRSKSEAELGWIPQYDINEMMETAWRWEQALQKFI
ncbi:MAG: UDP-glucose 4-epimerase GalE [Taibaiella sp.]|nr:UDP-glucose 4-epimerase GalE [Taibaiella sp.]